MREGLLEVRQRRSRLHRGVGQGPRKYPIPVNLLDDIEDSWNIFVYRKKKQNGIKYDSSRFRKYDWTFREKTNWMDNIVVSLCIIIA